MNKSISSVFSIFSLLLFISCETIDSVSSNNTKTDIDEYYTVIKKSYEIPNECKLKPDEEPEIFFTNQFSTDFYTLQSYYFYPIGYTGWNGTAKGVNEMEQYAKKLCRRYGAKLALCSYEYTDTRSGWTQYGSYEIKRYDCNIYLFVLHERSYIQMPKIGIAWRDMNSAERLEAKRNTGAYISVVYEKSPAFYANLSRGDIIIEINGQPIFDGNSVHSATAYLTAGSLVNMKYLRNGQEHTSEFTIY